MKAIPISLPKKEYPIQVVSEKNKKLSANFWMM
jgi:hypothetical protein